MTSLRARIALLLILAIVGVEVLIMGAAWLVLGPPGPPHSIEPVARQVLLLKGLAESSSSLSTASTAISPDPPAGRIEPGLTGWLRSTLAGMGQPLAAEVRRPPPPASFVVAIPIAGRGWIAMPMPDLPPPGGAVGPLVQFLILITTTAAAAALLAAYRMTRPLAVLEQAIASVGPDAVLPPLPEKGPAEVKATAAALNRLSARLRAAMESRMRLVAAAGHDLRTPMTRMRLRAEFLPPDEQRPWIADLDELGRIADSAMQLVKEEVSPERAEVLQLDALIRSVASELAEQGLAIQVGSLQPAEVCVGKLALSRALRNLLINAATHGRGATVALEANPTRAVLTIEDQGPGIAEDLLARVFEPFFRADPARGQTIPGAGLGLSIAREIITRAGGSISIANRPEGGLRQIVTLPLDSSTVSGGAQSEHVVAEGRAGAAPKA